MTTTIRSEDPFSDDNMVLSAMDFDDIPLTPALHTKTLTYADKVTVPILDPLPHLTAPWSPSTSISSPSTTPSPTQETHTAPIEWSNADLMYLLSCLHPHHFITNALTFSPALDDLLGTASPIHLRLFHTITPATPPPSAYSKHLPIGSGRPHSRILIAESHSKCRDPASARRTLVKNLLGDSEFVGYMFDKYNVLATLYSSSDLMLLSLKRGTIEMLGTGEDEWYERAQQLWGEVDEKCALEARMEIFLLGWGGGRWRSGSGRWSWRWIWRIER